MKREIIFHKYRYKWDYKNKNKNLVEKKMPKREKKLLDYFFSTESKIKEEERGELSERNPIIGY